MRTKYHIIEDERYPTLYLDKNDHGFYTEDELVEIADVLVEDWKKAQGELIEAEDAIRAYAKTGLI